MKCNFCHGELGDGVFVCPNCGSVAFENEAGIETAQNPQANTVKQNKIKNKIWMKILAGVSSVLLLGALAVVLLYAFGIDLRPKENDIYYKDTYAVSDKKAVKCADNVVAEINGHELTNGALQVYLKMQIVDFLNEYSSYMSYIGLDTSKSLSSQKCYFDPNVNWEQYFINTAIEGWMNYQRVYDRSVEVGFTPSEALISSLDMLPADIEKLSEEEGFETTDAFIQDRFGAGTVLQDYLDYCKLMYVCSEYLSQEPSEEEVEAFYLENEEYFIEKEIAKENGPMVSVRHILLQPHEVEEEQTEETETTESTEGTEATTEQTEPVETTVATEATESTEAETAENTDATEAAEETVPAETEAVEEESGFSAEAWADCLVRADELLAQWKAGDATEESFAALANEYSEDGGSNTNGGLYSGVTASTSFVPEFLEWCLDENRQIGDTGIIKTDYGYHIMYFSATEPIWQYYAAQYFMSDRADKLVEETKSLYTYEINYKNIAIPVLVLE